MKEGLLDNHVSRELNSLAGLSLIKKESVKETGLSVFTKRYILNLPEPVIEEKDFEPVINDACKLLFEYTVKPCQTLAEFIFGDLDSQKSLLAVKKLSIFRFYKYYPDTISNYLKEEDKVIFTKNEFNSLISETNAALNEKLVNNISGVKIKNLFLQIFILKYFKQDKINLDSKIPFEFTEAFLSDKNFAELREKLYLIPDAAIIAEVSLKELIKALTGKYRSEIKMIHGDKVHAEGYESVELTVLDSGNPEAGKIELIVSDTIDDTAEAEERVVMDFEHDRSDLYSPSLIKASKEQTRNDFPTEIIEETSFTLGRNELKRLFRPYELKDICKKVFKNKKSRMFLFFGEIESINDWDTVSEKLKDHFLEMKIDPYDNTVLLFVDVLQDHYSRKV